MQLQPEVTHPVRSVRFPLPASRLVAPPRVARRVYVGVRGSERVAVAVAVRAGGTPIEM